MNTIIYGIGLLVVSVFISYNWGYSNGYDGGEAVQKAASAKVQQALSDANATLRDKHAKKISELTKANNEINVLNAKSHERQLQALRTDLVSARRDADQRGGLRISAEACTGSGLKHGSTTTETTSAIEHYASTARTIKLPDRVEEGLWSLSIRADTVVEQARACQNWIKAQGFYGEPTP